MFKKALSLLLALMLIVTSVSLSAYRQLKATKVQNPLFIR